MDSHNVAWLAGLYDGDGCFGLYKHQVTSSKRRLVPRIHLITTCTKTHARVKEVLAYLGVGNHTHFRETPFKNGVETHFRFSPRYDLNVVGLKRTGTFLPLIIPYLVTKQEEAKLLLEFNESRMSRGIRDPYTPRELEIDLTLRALKRTRYESS